MIKNNNENDNNHHDNSNRRNYNNENIGKIINTCLRGK